jgi:hypothetical protein
MFQWKKSRGCGCHPRKDGTERYLLNVGDVYGGVVESHPSETLPGEFVWESWYTVGDRKVSGMKGGPGGRNVHMEWIEQRITDALSQIESARSNTNRQIVDSLAIKDDVTGEFVHRVLPASDSPRCRTEK